MGQEGADIIGRNMLGCRKNHKETHSIHVQISGDWTKNNDESLGIPPAIGVKTTMNLSAFLHVRNAKRNAKCTSIARRRTISPKSELRDRPIELKDRPSEQRDRPIELRDRLQVMNTVV